MTAVAGRKPSSALSLVAPGILIIVTALAVLAPLVAPHGEADFIGGVWEGPSENAWLGTDNLGRDILSRLLYGGRVSISIGFVATTLSCIIGSALGFIAAVSSPLVDNVLSRAADALMSVPKLIMALVVLSVLGTSLPIMIGTIVVIDSTRFFRLSRLVAKRIYSFEFVEVARLRGEGLGWIIGREILPNAWPPLLAEFGIRFALTLLFVAALSFLGLGVQPPYADWGIMVRENAPAIPLGKIAPFAPALAIALMAISVNLTVDWFVGKRGRVAMSAPILRIEQLRVTAIGDGDEKCLVEDISFELAKSEVLGLMGESGAGKSTVGLAVLGYTRHGYKIGGGRVVFDDIDILSLPLAQLRQLRGQRISYIAQSAAASFNPAIKIIDQVCEGPVRHGIMSRAKAEAQATQLFAELLLPAPETFGDRYPHQVSGGQLQRAMVAMAMICQPQVLVLDEPTTALDVTTQIEVLAAIRRTIRNHGTAALYISHDLAVVAQMADRIAIMRNGRIVEMGDTRDIIERPQQDYTRQLVAERASDHVERSEEQKSDPILQLQAVNASYGPVKVVDDVSFELRRGETFAVVGEFGSGKSTLARIICGLKTPTDGQILFDGRRLAPMLQKRSKQDLIRIQLIYQMPDVALNSKQTIETIIGRPLQLFSRTSAERRRARVAELLAMMELPAEIIDRKPPSLSGGQKQRVCIARALAAEPELIICDEVTSALDPLVANSILELLRDIQVRTSVTYLFITHDLAVVRRIADRVAVMQRGRLVESGTVDEIFTPPHHPYTARLLASMPEMRVNWLDDAIAASVLATATSKASARAHDSGEQMPC